MGTVSNNPEPQSESVVNDPDYSLGETLSHLLRRSHFHAESLFAQLFDDLGITSRQLALMVAVAENPGRSQRHLSKAVSLDVNTVSDTLRRMERKTLISRETSENDGRSVTVSLTGHGEQVLKTAMDKNARFQEQVSQKLDPEETAQLKELIRKLLHSQED